MDYPETIDEVWLFGSQARGDATPTSDADVLVVSDLDDITPLDPWLRQTFGQNADIAHYTWQGISTVIEHASLFAQHLRQEGKPVFQRTDRLRRQLDVMPDYHGHLQDLKLLGQLLEDLGHSIRTNSSAVVFEYGVLGTAVRNTAIIMTHFFGRVDFSTQAPYTLEKLNPALALPMDMSDYELLQQCRREGERGLAADTKNLDQKQLLLLCSQVKMGYAKCIAIVQQHVS